MNLCLTLELEYFSLNTFEGVLTSILQKKIFTKLFPEIFNFKNYSQAYKYSSYPILDTPLLHLIKIRSVYFKFKF